MDIEIQIGPDNAWLEVSIDGKKEFAAIASPDTIEKFVAKRELFILTGRISSTKVFINDVPVDFENNSGVGRINCKITKEKEEGFECGAD